MFETPDYMTIEQIDLAVGLHHDHLASLQSEPRCLRSKSTGN